MSPAPDQVDALERHRSEDTIVLGRSVPYQAMPEQPGVSRTAGRNLGYPLVESPIVDHGGLHHALRNRREGNYSAPPPPRVRRRSWMPSSVVIAGGGVAAVLAAGEFSDVPTVATVAVIATVLCGALLVAAQITEELRRIRYQARRSGLQPTARPA